MTDIRTLKIKEPLTTRQLARVLNVHINTVRRWSNKGLLRPIRVGPRGDRKFTRDEVIRILNDAESHFPIPERVVVGGGSS
jgi:excisionase family DNA binding protein